MPLFSAASAYDHKTQAYQSPSQNYADETKKKSCCTTRLVIKGIILSIILAAAAVALFYALTPSGGVKEWFLHTPPAGLKAAHRWQNGGYGGLKLTVLSAVDDNYQTLLYEWVQRWDNGTPDALTLMTQQVAQDSECAPVDGVLKVCNGNYGNTGWRGIDMSTLYNGYIINSAAKLNDYYLIGEKDDWKEYTM
jgi:hypothetical protein